MKHTNNARKIDLKNLKKEINKSIPDEIKVLFGKFYLFSFCYLIFFFILYPFWLINKVSTLFSIILIIILILFYLYMIVDVCKKRGNFLSTLFVLLIMFVFMGISFSIIKLFV